MTQWDSHQSLPAPRLLMVEGIIGSGKTTTALWLHEFLQNNGIASQLFLEGDLNHPADYEHTAWFDASEWNMLSAAYPEHVATIREMGQPCDSGGYLVEYGKVENALGSRLPAKLYEHFVSKSVYDGTPLEIHQRLVSDRWHHFAQSQLQCEVVTIFECCFLQNPLMKFVVQHDVESAALVGHLAGISEALLPLNPVVIYLSPPDVERTLARAIEQRSPQWLEAVIRYHADQLYGKTHGLRGRNGLVEFSAVRQTLERSILAKLPLRTVVVDAEVSPERWPRLETLLNQWYNV